MSEIWFVHPQAGTKSERVTERTGSDALRSREEAGGNRRDRPLGAWRDGVRAEARSGSSKGVLSLACDPAQFPQEAFEFLPDGVGRISIRSQIQVEGAPSSLKSMSQFNSESVMSRLVTQR